MNIITTLLILVPISVICWWIYLAYKYTHPRKLSWEQARFLAGAYNKILRNKDHKALIIDIDKLYHKILLWIGHKWDFWAILKSETREIGDINKIWNLHKMRNKLVHDFNTFDEEHLRRNADEYKKEVQILLKKVS